MKPINMFVMVWVVVLFAWSGMAVASAMPPGQTGQPVPLATTGELYLPVISQGSENATPVPSGTPSLYTIAGHVQKGPYVQGTEITVRELDMNFVPTGRTFSGRIDDNTGHFSMRSMLAYPYVEIAANGFYFNEISGNLSVAQLNLQALADLRDNTTVNVNLLTHLEYARVLALIESGLSFSAAKVQAQREVLAIFNIERTAIGRSETLDIAQDGEGNAILLAISVILQSDKSEAKLTELLAALGSDLRTDGTLTGASLRQTLQAATEYLKPRRALIRNHIVNRYGDLGVPATIPPFESYAFRLDTVAPTVVRTAPGEGADQSVSLVSIEFSELMEHVTIDSTTVRIRDASGNPVTGTLAITDTDSATRVYFTPANLLFPDNYQLTIFTGTQDYAGNGLEEAAIVGFTHTLPIADLAGVNSLPTHLGRAVYFTATISSGSNVAFLWDFGDQSTGSGAIVTHIYDVVGYYTAMVTATNSLGSQSMPMRVTVFNGWTEDEVLIPASSFQMGCDGSNVAETHCDAGEQPLHTVTLDAYIIDKYEVTNARYRVCVDASQCMAPALASSNSRLVYYGDASYADYPMIGVDWPRASEFCIWAGKRLPTEAEWEKAARGSTDTRKYSWGNNAPDCTMVNFNDVTDGAGYCVGDTSRVGAYPAGASPYGVMDMAGNVREWTHDWYAFHYYDVSPAVNPQGPSFSPGLNRIVRGGSWLSDDVYLRTANRDLATDDLTQDNSLGFRCVRSQ